jgi:DNA-binding transcriptional regulator YdaS (Cro superfamily)
MAKTLAERKLEALNRAISAVGGVGVLAGKLGKHQTVVSQWKRRKQVPAEWVRKVEQVSGVACHELRPDVFPKPAKVA